MTSGSSPLLEIYCCVIPQAGAASYVKNFNASSVEVAWTIAERVCADAPVGDHLTFELWHQGEQLYRSAQLVERRG